MLWVASWFISKAKAGLQRTARVEIDTTKFKSILKMDTIPERDMIIQHVHACLQNHVAGSDQTEEYKRYLERMSK